MKDILLSFPSFSVKPIWKMSPLVLGEALVVFVKRFIADAKYPVLDRENMLLPIEMQ